MTSDMCIWISLETGQPRRHVFLSFRMSRACPKGAHMECAQVVLSLLGSCSSYVADVSLGSSGVGAINANFSWVIELLQAYLLSCVSERIFFTEPESYSSMELLETFRDGALQSEYSPWE